MASDPIKISVIGMGMSATVFHIPFILSLPHLYTLHSVLERKATPTFSEARNRYGSHINVVTSLEELLQDQQVQCVVISTPNSTHFPFAEAILEAGKHVIVEKPLVGSAEEAATLIELARSKGKVIATYQNRRYDSDFLTLAKHLPTLGDIAEFETRYDRWRPVLKGGGSWKEEGGKGNGIVYDLGSHLIDQVLTLFGTPDRVYGHVYNARKLGPDEFHDSFSGQFYYDSPPTNSTGIPLVVTLHGSPLSAVEPQLRFSVKGTKGSFVKFGVDPQEDQLKLNPPMTTDHPEFGVEPESLQATVTLADPDLKAAQKVPTERGRYISWYENVARALQAGDPELLYVKPQQARETIRMIELLYESSRLGQVLSAKE